MIETAKRNSSRIGCQTQISGCGSRTARRWSIDSGSVARSPVGSAFYHGNRRSVGIGRRSRCQGRPAVRSPAGRRPVASRSRCSLRRNIGGGRGRRCEEKLQVPPRHKKSEFRLFFLISTFFKKKWKLRLLR